jgi:ABC-2 type transport system permease protein
MRRDRGLGAGEAEMNTTATLQAAASAGQLPSTIRSGAGHWLRSLHRMLRFDLRRARQWAPMMAVAQVFMGAGMAVMYGFFYPEVDEATALYIATGTPTLALIPLGLLMLPESVNQQRLEGTFDFIWSLPAPRTAQATSTFLLYTLLSLPGMVLSLVVATLLYGVQLSVSLLIVPAVLLSALMAVSVGFGMALAIPNPMVVSVITSALTFVVLLFSPIVYPPSHLPGWLFTIHQALPFYNMAVVIRAGLSVGLVSDLTQSFLVLGAWTAAGWAMTGWVIGRRR